MKNKTWVITVLSIAAFAAGCDKQQTTSQQIDKVQTETKAAAADMKARGSIVLSVTAEPA